MHSPTDGLGRLGEEPEDGDFVAYLARIEHRQLAELPAQAAQAAPTFGANAATVPRGEGRGPALTAAEAQALRDRLRRSARPARQLVGAAFLGLLGLFFALRFLLDGGGLPSLLLAVFLLWRAAVALRRATRPATDGSAASNLVDTLRAQPNRRTPRT